MYNEPVADLSLVACQHCDLLQRLPELAPGASARCPRCNKELWRRREDSLNRTLALTLGAAVLDPRLIWDATSSNEVRHA